MLRKAKKERLIWLDITITLLALELMAYFLYGLRAVSLAALCICVSLTADIISARLMGRRFTADDLSCTSDGLIISLMLPASMDYAIAGIACVFAITAAKNVFGGRRNMIFSPAAAAYVFILTSWGRELLLFPDPHTRLGIFDKPETLARSASNSFNLTGKIDYTDIEILMGNFSGPAGAVSILLLVIAAVMLIFRGDISAGAFLGSVIGTAFSAAVSPIGYSRVDSVSYSLVTNMVLFASVYIIADRRIAPKRDYFAFFYGFFIAVFSYILVLTTGKENAVVMVSVLFTPVALGLKSLEKHIDFIAKEEMKHSSVKAEPSDIQPVDASGEEAENCE